MYGGVGTQPGGMGVDKSAISKHVPLRYVRVTEVVMPTDCEQAHTVGGVVTTVGAPIQGSPNGPGTIGITIDDDPGSVQVHLRVMVRVHGTTRVLGVCAGLA